MTLSTPVVSAAVARRRTWFAVALLLAIYLTMALWASREKGASFDEGEQLVSGYDIWLRDDFRMEGANGDFVKRWATLPLLFSRPNMVSTFDPSWRSGDAYWVGFKFFFESGNNPDAILLQGRVMIALLGVATGLLVFWCARELFGDAGGMLALAAFVFSPNMLAFGAIVSTEMSVCFALLGSTWCVWRLLHRITWGRIAASLAFFALLVLAKPTAALLLPVTAVMIVGKLASGRPLEVVLFWPRRVLAARSAQLKYFVALTIVHAIVGWTAIWAHYDFKFDSSPNPADRTITRVVNEHRDEIVPELLVALRAAQDHRWFPESYIRGIRYLLGHNDERHAFMDGQWTYGGWRDFYLRAALAKTRPAFAAVLLLGLGWWGWHRWRVRRGPVPGAPVLPAFYEALPYFTLVAIYVAAAVSQNLNIGHRHILPIYPIGYVLTGSVALLWTASRVWLRALLGALCACFVVETLWIAPNYLAYFSPLTGGPVKGYTQLVDSSLDWGMNLPGLRRWLDKNNPAGREPVYLAYFGTDSPAYRGIVCHRLPGFFEWGTGEHFPLRPGIYAISATLLQTVYTRTFGPWNKVFEHDYQTALKNIAAFERTAGDPEARAALLRQYSLEEWALAYEGFENLRFGRLCAWLRHHGDPPDNIGYSILIWRLDAAALREAQFGPPAELAEAPVRPQ